MFNKFASFLGFNTGESCIGLSQLADNNLKTAKKENKNVKKDLKLSDLMRGN